MKETFNFVPKPYIFPAVGIIASIIITSKLALSIWVLAIIYLVVLISLLVALLKHRSVTITNDMIEEKRIIGTITEIKKDEIDSYERSTDHSSMRGTTWKEVNWVFHMKSGKKEYLWDSNLENKEKFVLLVDKFVSRLRRKTKE